MEKLVRLTAATILAAILFCSCGEVKIESITLSKNAAELKEGESVTLSAVVAPENATESYGWKSADEGVAERELFDYMTGTMLESFYNASAVRIRKIYNNPASSDTVQGIIVDLEGTNRLGGTTYDLYGIFRLRDQVFFLPCGDGEIDLSQPMPTDVMDPAKINAALEEYWSNVGMHG